MRNPKLAGRYAKALMDLASEQGRVEEVFQSVNSLEKTIAQSAELKALFRSPIISTDKKLKVSNALGQQMQMDNLTLSFCNLIINKNRDYFLFEILEAFVDLYKVKNNIAKVALTVAHPLSDAMKASIEQGITKQLSDKKIELNIKVDEKLIGGFILESNNKLFDASIARDLRDIKEQFNKNLHIPSLR